LTDGGAGAPPRRKGCRVRLRISITRITRPLSLAPAHQRAASSRHPHLGKTLPGDPSIRITFTPIRTQFSLSLYRSDRAHASQARPGRAKRAHLPAHPTLSLGRECTRPDGSPRATRSAASRHPDRLYHASPSIARPILRIARPTEQIAKVRSRPPFVRSRKPSRRCCVGAGGKIASADRDHRKVDVRELSIHGVTVKRGEATV